MKNKTYNRLVEKARCYRQIIANQIFVDYLHKRPLDEVCERVKLHAPVIKKLRDQLERAMRRTYKQNVFVNEQGIKYTPVFEPDDRTGDETYGYESLEAIEGNLEYISDRFSAEFRLTWLLGVPEKVELLKVKQ